MVKPEGQPLFQYEGVANLKGTTYRVSVLARSAWKSDIERAINKAGGYNASLSEGKTVGNKTELDPMFAFAGIAYAITFQSDSVLTERSCARPSSLTRLLRSDFSLVPDGDLQDKRISRPAIAGKNSQLAPLRSRP